MDQTPGAWQQAYAELRIIAERLLRSERRDHTLQPTALVHETYLRFERDARLHGLDQAGILSCAARTMRDVLVEHARRRNAQKRGGDLQRIPLDEAVLVYEQRATDLEALDVALRTLEQIDPQLAAIVDLRFFGGLTEAQTAGVLAVDPRTVRRGWAVARRWLADAMQRREAARDD